MNNKTILVVVAHPDDEVLGCGGTIARHASTGDKVVVLCLGDGVSSRDTNCKGDLEKRREAASKAASIMGVHELKCLSYPDNRMDTVPLLNIIKDIENLIDAIKPDIVYTHHYADINVDHRCVHDAVIVACRPQPYFSVSQLIFFETASSTEWRPNSSLPNFSPNLYIDITKYLPIKNAALHAYNGEMRPFPHPRSIEAIEYLAKWRGACSGFSAAEAFSIGYWRK